MILFNLIFSKNISGLSDSLYTNSMYTVKFLKHSSKSTKKSTPLAYVVKSPDVLSHSSQSVASKNLLIQSLWQKVVNTLWRKTIFLSASSKALDKYSIQLTSLSNYRHKSAKKYLVSKFSKSLFRGSVNSSFIDISSINSSILSNIQYNWSQVLYFRPDNLFNQLLYAKSENYSKNVKDYLFKNKSFNHFPLFTISNNLGQMIISEPPEELNLKPNLLDYLSFKYKSRYIYEGWFFTNFEDAQEYMQYINKYYGLQPNKLKIFTCSFSTFYTIINKFSNQVNFRLIPDLKEISELIKKYRYYKNIVFHNKQKHSKIYFQGQPLYLLQMIDHNDYSYVSKDKQKYNLIFTNYKTALKVWYQLNKKVKASSSNLVKVPNLEVYNLEHFIEDQVKAMNNFKYPFLLVPSQSSYKFTKAKQLKKNQEMIYDTMYSYLSYLKLWSKRVIWSLTSRQPYDW